LKKLGEELGIGFVTTDHHALIARPDVPLLHIIYLFIYFTAIKKITIL
jgi:hypothetical protein